MEEENNGKIAAIVLGVALFCLIITVFGLELNRRIKKSKKKKNKREKKKNGKNGIQDHSNQEQGRNTNELKIMNNDLVPDEAVYLGREEIRSVPEKPAEN